MQWTKVMAIFLFMSFGGAVAEDKLVVETGTVECQNKSGTIKRTIEVVDDEDGCTLFYTRDSGTPEQMGRAVNHRNICNEVKHKIIANLEKAGLTCD